MMKNKIYNEGNWDDDDEKDRLAEAESVRDKNENDDEKNALLAFLREMKTTWWN